MAYFIQLDDSNIITQIVEIDNNLVLDENNIEQESLGIEHLKSVYGSDTNWKQTFYDSSVQGNYAEVGFTYNLTYNVCLSPKPYNSWVLNTGSFFWESPIPYPTGDATGSYTGPYFWNENITNWTTASLE